MSDTSASPLTIDATDLVDGSEKTLRAVARSIVSAREHSGFFYLANHGISDAAQDQIIETTKSFFALSESDKNSVAIDKNNRGYLGFGEAKMYGAKRTDLKEVFFFGREIDENDPDWLAGLPLIGPNQWPLLPPQFKSNVLNYLTATQAVGDALLRAFALALGNNSDFFKDRYTRPMSRGQLIHYPPIPANASEDQFSVAAHSDFGCITLLLQVLPGLEVQTHDQQWTPVPPQPGTLVINIGDLLERWTNGYLASTRHRVRNHGNQDRYSVAIFHDPSSGAVVDPNDFASHAAQSTNNDSEFAAISAGQYILGRSKGVFAQFKN